jgi:methylated-DNA-[protein]-cysteine S-methyltransferase
MGMVWCRRTREPRIRRVFLPGEVVSAESLLRRFFPGARPRSCAVVDQLVERMRRFLCGEGVTFSLGTVALETCAELQSRVLLLERRIPRGWVSTYGRIARRLGIPRGARAVGSALAHNPFPIIIPCHRAVKTDGHLGGFQGGIEMKRALLALEGNVFAADGRIVSPLIFY